MAFSWTQISWARARWPHGERRSLWHSSTLCIQTVPLDIGYSSCGYRWLCRIGIRDTYIATSHRLSQLLTLLYLTWLYLRSSWLEGGTNFFSALAVPASVPATYCTRTSLWERVGTAPKTQDPPAPPASTSTPKIPTQRPHPVRAYEHPEPHIGV